VNGRFDRFRQVLAGEKQLKQVRRLVDRFVDVRQSSPSVPIFGIFVPFSFFCFSLYDNFQSVYNHEFSVNKNVRKLLAVDPTRLADFLTSVSFKWSVSYGEVASFSLVLLK
jgi:hypothetical protein